MLAPGLASSLRVLVMPAERRFQPNPPGGARAGGPPALTALDALAISGLGFTAFANAAATSGAFPELREYNGAAAADGDRDCDARSSVITGSSSRFIDVTMVKLLALSSRPPPAPQ